MQYMLRYGWKNRICSWILNAQFTVLPIPMAVRKRKRLSIEVELWSNVLETTGQPKKTI
jgi:hypothetical protein